MKKILIAIFLMVSSFAYSAPSVEEVFFEKMLVEALSVLKAENIKESEKKNIISKMVTKNIAKLHVARSILGQPWRKLKKSEKREYVNTFGVWVGKVVAKRLLSLKIKQDIKMVRVYRGANNIVTIRTQTVHPKSNKKIIIDWYIRIIKNEPKLLDVSIQNISMTSTQRSEFISVYTRSGIRELIDRMKSQY